MPKNKDNIKLSILILSIPSRFDIVRPLIDKLIKQIGDREDIEILSLMDNKSLHIYEKRNELLKIARGSHLIWLDDDDDVSDDYVATLTKAIQDNPFVDVVSFNQICYLEGRKALVFAAMDHPHQPVTWNPKTNQYNDTLRRPWHWCLWRTSLARSESFNEKYDAGGQSCEDIDWLERLYPKVKNSMYLKDSFLHIYRWSSKMTESIL